MEQSTFHSAYMLLIKPSKESKSGTEYWCGQCNTWIGQPNEVFQAMRVIGPRMEQHIKDEPSCEVLMQIANEKETVQEKK